MMAGQFPWAQAVGMTDAEVARIGREVPKNESLVFWCLTHEKFNRDAYMNWAREHYGLASLTNEFTPDQVNRELWSQIQTVANWSEEMLPIHQWDGVIFVACVEPRSDIRWSFQVQFVLASDKFLKSAWAKLTSEERTFAAFPPTPDKQAAPSPVPPPTPVATPSPAVAAATPPPVIVAEAPKPKAATPPPVIVAEAPKPAVAPTKSEAPAVVADEPMGLNLSAIKIESVNKQEDFMGNLENLVKSTTKEVDFSVPENLSWKPAQVSKDEALAPEGIKLKTHTPTFATETTPTSTMMPTATSIAAEESVIELPDLSNFTNDLFDADNKSPSPTGSATIEMPTASGISAPPTPPASRGLGSLDRNEVTATNAKSNVVVMPPPGATPTVPSEQTQTNSFASQILNEAARDFQAILIMTVTGESAKPAVWDGVFRPQPGKQDATITLSEPSAFRIAFRTKLPYLGHVVETPANRDFFNSWGFNAFPPKILVQPIVEGGKVQALMLGLCDPARKDHLLTSAGDRLAPLIKDAFLKSKAA